MSAGSNERLYPKRVLMPAKVAIAYVLERSLRRGTLRECRSMHECCLCDEPITWGQFYFDKGLKLRAHTEHLKRDPETGCLPGCTCAEG